MTTTATLQFGTQKQTDYGTRLLPEAPYQSLLDAAADILERDPDALLAQGVTVEDATKVITVLEQSQQGFAKAPAETPTTAPTPTPSPTPAHNVTVANRPHTPQRFLTARLLRQIAQGLRTAPSVLDEDAAWVLEHLRVALTIRAMFVAEPVQPINGTTPITIDHLLAVFGDLDSVAQAFNVSLGTVKGWGSLLPPRYVDRAEVSSGGRLRAPR